ncbi:O-antigen ligase family protein, partial [bacterium]|nr:O-antigen ligase family protein [bacterium]
VYLSSLRLVAAAPVLGVGAGMFGDAFAVVRAPSILARYEHAHSDYLEILCETGPLGLAAIAAMILWTVVASLRARARRTSRFARSIALGALVGVVAVGAHGLVDFNFAIPANLVTFFALLALAYVTATRVLKN